MPTSRIPATPVIAIIADMVKSREVSRVHRPKVQQQFKDFVAALNKSYSRAILSRFVITLGDEFQGLLSSATPIPNLLWDLDRRFTARRLRAGIGIGILHTPLQKEAINIDGPALYAARSAIEIAAEKRAFGGVFFGFGDLDPVLNGFARILWFHRSRMTAQQLKTVELLRHGRSQSGAAHELGVTRQAVSKQVVSSGWWIYDEAESALRVLLENYVNPKLHKRHA